MKDETLPDKDNKRRVDVWMEGSLREALRLRAARRGMLIATYVRDLVIQDTGWKPEDRK